MLDEENRWLMERGGCGDAYDAIYQQRAAAGEDVHGEADFVAALGGHSVLDAGCGTGRVALWRGAGWMWRGWILTSRCWRRRCERHRWCLLAGGGWGCSRLSSSSMSNADAGMLQPMAADVVPARARLRIGARRQ